MAARLNQVLAIEKGTKPRVYAELSELNKLVQKPELFNGFSKTYQKIKDDGEDLPPEKKRVQFNSAEVLRRARTSLSELMDLTARKDWTNCVATADVKVDGDAILRDVPVTYLLFLEKQLTDVRTFIGNIPLLDDAEDWKEDGEAGLYKADATKTHRTAKVQEPIVLYGATVEHPAQTQLISKDVLVGYWTQVKTSGALPKPEKDAMLERVEKVLKGVKEAREEANTRDQVDTPDVGEQIFGFILEG